MSARNFYAAVVSRSLCSASTRDEVKSLLARADALHEQGHLSKDQYIVASHSGRMALEHEEQSMADTRLEILRDIVRRGAQHKSEVVRMKMKDKQALQEYMDLPQRHVESGKNPFSSCTIA
ncbi:hypothetical protein GUITHDRAFT_119282 [Guillardia theta CCMP2712]|uniref:Uncharacterized protein n=2 Tax=Guillardia theta TaxID=55529 RepID=L1IE82_GUITC|nr:hypothetical protein GUITHDRAFT_119282 [Guillardia theta CCMP2712]EKX34538.1 hypothetical protein GUITHDRAFT_119282 [Guillardia theta CCMP2712]|eukprot:XP_005821518.1 hypothetical protein GUITHDRAFT_119282 [Guillardia theta CCMP2712]